MIDLSSGSPIDVMTLSKVAAPIGEIKQSMLTVQEFNAENLGVWVLADGRNVSGSIYETITGRSNVPDLRGVFLRGKNNGRSDGNENPDGEKDLGHFTTDKFKSHNHLDSGRSYNGYQMNGGISVSSGSRPPVNESSSYRPYTGDTGSNETAPKNVTVNFFIKIGY